MTEPWMALDNSGDPIPITVFDKLICRVIEVEAFQGRAEGSGRLSEMLGKHEPGDVILWYTSPDADWQANMGSEGYALVRRGYLVHDVMTRMN